MPLNCIVAERRWYLAVAFLALGLSPWLARWRRVTVPLLVVLAGLTMLRNRDWRDELSLWSVADPEQPRVQLYLGNAHAARATAGEDTAHHWAAARLAYQRAWALDPGGDLGQRAWHNLGSVRFSRGDLAGAVRAYRQVLARDPDYVDAWLNLGHIARLTGSPAWADSCYARAQRQARYPVHRDRVQLWR